MAEPAKRKTHHAPHGELLVQMQINPGNATAGGSGANVPASAVMSVLVTLNGEPVDDLGTNAGNQTSVINLPAGWTLRDGFNVRPGGCNVRHRVPEPGRRPLRHPHRAVRRQPRLHLAVG
jgi:hypothetical protein